MRFTTYEFLVSLLCIGDLITSDRSSFADDVDLISRTFSVACHKQKITKYQVKWLSFFAALKNGVPFEASQKKFWPILRSYELRRAFFTYAKNGGV